MPIIHLDNSAYLFVHFVELVDQTDTLVGQDLEEEKDE
jgi:hypothetical protein